MTDYKSLFASTTFWGAILSLWLAIAPDIKESLQNGWKNTSWLDLTTQTSATLLILIGRHNATAVVYTPKFLPGRNKPTNVDR